MNMEDTDDHGSQSTLHCGVRRNSCGWNRFWGGSKSADDNFSDIDAVSACKWHRAQRHLCDFAGRDILYPAIHRLSTTPGSLLDYNDRCCELGGHN
jgi:hypothetical protein